MKSNFKPILSTKKVERINYSTEEEKWLKRLFLSFWWHNLKQRGSDKNLIFDEKMKNALKYCYDWSVCSNEFPNDLRKGIMIISNQGFGKDILLSSIVDFFDYFHKTIRSYRYAEFKMDWYNKPEAFFTSPIKINDITGDGKIKRERESRPFLEFLDYREQINQRRGLLASTNFMPDELQKLHEEVDKVPRARLNERIKECFNILVVSGVQSKRIEDKYKL